MQTCIGSKYDRTTPKAYNSIFELIDKKNFDKLVKKWGVDKGVRSLSTWELVNALITCFNLKLENYRDVESALGISDSTFGDALRNRNFGFFQDLCDMILLDIWARSECRKVKRAIQEVLAIDYDRVKNTLYLRVYL